MSGYLRDDSREGYCIVGLTRDTDPIIALSVQELVMASCEKLKACLFFNDKLSNMPSVSGLLKETYCLGDKEECARYRVSSAGKAVPEDLFPNDTTRARKIIHSS